MNEGYSQALMMIVFGVVFIIIGLAESMDAFMIA
jgi:hypothetical protein